MAITGYKTIYKPDYYCATKQGYVAEHRYMAEQKLGRHLKKGEFIHHIDRNPSNNDPENLMVFHTKADHQRYHLGGELELLPDGSYVCVSVKPKKACEYCGRVFLVSSTATKYCCKECSMLARRKYEMPTKAKLKRMLLEFSISQIATIYGVPNATINRWCLMYHLPHNMKEIKIMREKEKVKELERKKKLEDKKRQAESDKLRMMNEGEF